MLTARYADHSTANPLGVSPPSSVTILRGSKFAAADDAAAVIDASPGVAGSRDASANGVGRRQ